MAQKEKEKFLVTSYETGLMLDKGIIPSGGQDRYIGYCSIINGALLNTEDLYKKFGSYIINFKEVSIYEGMPELIPDGMRYSKELDELVSDVISASDEYCSGIKVEFEKVVDYTEEKINQRENGFIKADLDKIDFTLVEPYAYQDLAKQLTIGAKKYSKDNWKKGDILSYLAALERHINYVKIALEENDLQKLIDDTGVNQGGALMFNSMAIHYFIRQILKDGEKNAK